VLLELLGELGHQLLLLLLLLLRQWLYRPG
jgi:hypothetical protein